MLFQTSKQIELERLKSLFGEERFNKIKKYYQINNRGFFKSVDSQYKFFGTLAQFPNRSFAFTFMKPVDFIDPAHIMKARSLSTKGIIFSTAAIPKDFERLVFRFSEIKRANKNYDDIKDKNDEIIDKHKSAKKKIKAENKESRAENKEMEKKWKKSKKVMKEEFDEVLEGMDDAQKKFMPPEPDYDPEPDYHKILTEPPEPRLRDLPRSISIHIGENKLHKTFGVAWNILSHFKFYLIDGTNHGILVKREEPFKYTYDNLNKIEMNEHMTIEEFHTYFDKNEKNEKALDNFRPPVSTNYEFLDLASENKSTFSGPEWVYTEERNLDEDDESLPSLAPIKPMHAASILSAGMKFSKEIKTDEGYLLIKSAPIKVFSEKIKVINGKKITEVYQQNESKLAIYNLDTRSLEVY